MEFLAQLNWQAVIIGAVSFLIIGLFHPIVIKGEYYFGKRIWPLFLAAGVAFMLLALCLKSDFWAIIVALVAFSSFWSIKELFEQEERVKKGWFPANPNNKRQ